MYQTVFDIREAGFQGWPFVLGGLAFVAIGFVLRKITVPPRGWNAPAWNWFRRAWLWFAVVWTALASGSIALSYVALRTALASGDVQIVEGLVERFAPMPYGGHTMESFTVQGVQFAYSDYSITNGFNHTESHGGPVHANCYVRISHVRGTIVRLEIKERSCPSDVSSRK